MLLDNEIKKLFHELLHREVAELNFEGSDIVIRIIDEGQKLSLSTVVYSGSNYIPPSVRKAAGERPPFDQNLIRTFLALDEENYSISLNYVGAVQDYYSIKFKDLLEEYSYLIHEWKDYFDRNDKSDLVYVRVK